MKHKRLLKLLLRIIISAIIIFVLLHNSSVVDIMDSLANTDHKILILGVALYLFGQIISAYKWSLLAKAAGFQKKMKEYYDYYFIGMFFNLFLPTTVGGDITRCYYLSRGETRRRRAQAIYTVLAERYTGVAVIVFMASIAMLTPLGKDVPIFFKALMLGLSAFIIIYTPLFRASMRYFFKKKRVIKFMLIDTRVYWDNKRLIIKALYWSLLFHMLIIAIHITIGKAMGIEIPLAYYFIVYPMSAMAGFLPVSFNGIGPREGAYILFFSLVGVKSSTALVFGIYWFGIVLLSSLIGGIFYIKGRHTPPPEDFEIEEADMSDESVIEQQPELDPVQNKA